jgi:uncharacterized protein DUF3551
MVTIITRLLFAAAAMTAATCAGVAVSHASFGGAPWCVVKTGDDIYWDCQYRTAQECMQVLAQGIRGSCNVNPSPGPAAQPQPQRLPRSQRR